MKVIMSIILFIVVFAGVFAYDIWKDRHDDK